jgi:FlaA1/EpsC-like NDP-sugar epimerase
MNECQKSGLTLKIIPPIEEVLRGGSHIPARDIDITDLLRRTPVELDDASIGELLSDRRVMVTGAGGSIGSEICRQVLRFNPAELILVGRGENRLFHIDMELRESYPSTRQHVLVGDVTDRVRMGQIFETYRPEIVFHAAAHKHVPMMENNAGEAVKNNVLGTKCVADLADEYDVKVFVLISTDKAVNPTSVMGTTKHLAERYVNALSSESTTQFVVVRFGNVLGSAGSVVPIFKSQIRRGGPITITDSKMTRYFMTIPEASQLVLQAASMGKGGEIFVLDMGEPVRILDLAQDMIRLSGLPQNSIEITSTGVRPGEKLYEELYFEEEQTLPTTHPKVRAAAHRLAEFAEVSRAIADLAELTAQPAAIIRAKLQELVPEYQPRKALTEAQRAASRL